MNLSRLLILQVIYCLMGIGYNVISYLNAASGGQQLSATAPPLGAIVMFCYGLFLIPGYLRFIKFYRLLMLIAIIVFGYGGVIKHIMNYSHDLTLYSSFTAWAFAIGINLFGLFLNIIASIGRFKLDERDK